MTDKTQSFSNDKNFADSASPRSESTVSPEILLKEITTKVEESNKEGTLSEVLTPKKFAKDFDASLLKCLNYQEVCHFEALPARFSQGVLTLLVVTANQPATLEFFKMRFKVGHIQQIIVSYKEIFEICRYFYHADIMKNTLYGLLNYEPSLSAHYVFSKRQFWVLSFVIFSLLACLFFDPKDLLIGIFCVFQVIYFVVIAFRMLLVVGGIGYEGEKDITEDSVKELKDEDLPIYTILIPVYKEAKLIPHLITLLKNMDYPKDKLDIIFLFEEIDPATLEVTKQENPPSDWRLLIVPESNPQTKPKACNYGLQFARGEYLTIYYADDLPAHDQLKKAILEHRKMGLNCLCVQAALNYFNVYDNTITRLFSLEYSYWYDYLLPGLSLFKLPIPLGGTSNHFSTRLLRKLGGWDPFNSAEDIDLGIRAYAHGMTVGVINSITLEEANSNYWNWIRQRSRWLKGYFQTALVYNRHPLRLLQRVGLKGWIAFQLLITGTPTLFLINPFIWLFFIFSLIDSSSTHPIFPLYLTLLGYVNIIFGNFLGIYFNMVGTFRRQLFTLLPFAFLNPLYWLFFHSAAAYKSLWQLFSNPFVWEKTKHGLTKVKPPEKN